jgi:hypothetical protein
MPNDVNVNQYSLTLQDFSRELSTVGFATVSAADNSTYQGYVTDFESAVSALTTGVPNTRTQSLVTRLSNQPSSDSTSARELKLLVRIEDNSTLKRYSFSIPTFDPDAGDFQGNSDFLNLTGTNEGPLVSAIEALVASPAGNPVTVVSLQMVGRSI